MIISIDFDGTIVDHEFPRIGKLKPLARETIQALKAAGHYIIVWTCRGGFELSDAYKFLKTNSIPFDGLNTPAPMEVAGFLPFPKIYADVYIDDKNLGGFPGWETARGILRNMGAF